MYKYATISFKYIFLLGFIFIPLFYWPFASVPFEVPKVWLVNRWIELLGFLGIIIYPSITKKEKVDLGLIILIILFMVNTLISSYLGADLYKSFWGNYYRQDGLFSLAHLILFFFVVVLFFRKKWMKYLNIAIGIGVFLLSLWTLYDGFLFYILDKQYIPSWEGAIGGPFGNPNFLAGYLIITLPIVFALYRKSKMKIKLIWITTLVTSVSTIFLTHSRAAIIGLFIICFYWMLKYKKVSLKHFSLLIITFLLTIIALINFFNIINKDKFIAESRTRIFTKGYLAFLKKPISGWGWANFDYAFESVDWPIKIEHDVYVDKAHSTFLEILVTTGSIGFIIYVLLILNIARVLYTNKLLREPYFLVFILYIVHSQTNLISIPEELVFWLLAGLSLNEPAIS